MFFQYAIRSESWVKTDEMVKKTSREQLHKGLEATNQNQIKRDFKIH